ncbi:MAG: adenylyltransferase/cytidyltransferase family protein, partial [Chlamydiia bacterium]|nr:adenylyltransferase/cytidyltransferase family protein [Chlamydiia bacterium]
YLDMVADLFHAGHINFIRQARSKGHYVIIGLMSDKDVESYKRLPIWTLAERTEAVRHCELVDEVIPGAPLAATEEFIRNHHIDAVIHGDDFDPIEIRKYYSVPIDMGIFETVPYTPGISTSDTIRRIKERG